MTRAAAHNATPASSEPKNPFGFATPGLEQHPAVTIPDAARRCRWIAVDLNASSFGVFFVNPSAERARLAPCFDADYPRTTGFTKLICGESCEELTRHARVSTLPCWWSSDNGSVSATNLAALTWTTRITPVGSEGSGIAFPAYAERGQCGLVIFSGAEIRLSAEQLPGIHARCFALFSAVARMQTEDSGRLPSISKRELECLKLTANGLTSEEIASRLKLSVHTANQYLTNTTQKLNAVNRMHAVAKGLRLGLIE
ncbi:helix-turn-helix transcriptional regulator [Pseudaminobacter soli (ex Li et al. 2025)]|uniref:Helix-turn-helix transcriptional regulator n=1 Tax=Pseudaminobacter soli (ex Li et al. 2025) TaxID=1295366 RepID=A0A2P7SDX2_9HYPH|nr:helix-turn-helix transcriptional regulator [Mesorhizobium soli]PSJ60673.1 helix-turn-helix transcriptional regulator [Mesorhizobium soli]